MGVLSPRVHALTLRLKLGAHNKTGVFLGGGQVEMDNPVAIPKVEKVVLETIGKLDVKSY
jgi:hypothetical protein